MGNRIILPPYLHLDSVRIMDFGQHPTEGAAFERVVLPLEGVPNERFEELAGVRLGFHTEFDIKPSGFFAAEKRLFGFPEVNIPVYEIPDIIGRTEDCHEKYSRCRAASTVLFERRDDIRHLEGITGLYGYYSWGMVNRLSTMQLGVASDNKALWLVEERPDDLLSDALEKARQSTDQQRTDALLSSLAALFREIGQHKLEPHGMCHKEHYVVKGGRVMIRGSFDQSMPGEAPAEIVGRVISHPDVAKTLTELLQGREMGKFFDDLYGPIHR